MSAQVGSRGDLQDQLRSTLLAYKQREINLTIDDLINKTGLNYSQVYQTLYRLQRMGELEILRDEDAATGRARVAGVRLTRMEPPSEVEQRIEERATERQVEKDLSAVSVAIPNVLEYMNQKLAIEKARAEILKANIDPNDVINFEPNMLGEEAIYLLSKVQEVLETNRNLVNDLEAEKRNARYYKERIGATTFDDSGT
jgi:hypothetical protein